MSEFEFGLRLARLREARDISARDMSLSLGQNPGYINSIESGRSDPSMKKFVIICEFLGISCSEFFDVENENPPELAELIQKCKRLSAYQRKLITAVIDEIIRTE